MAIYSMHQLGQSTLGLCAMPGVESASVGLWFRVGSRHEPEILNGAAHFIEHMLFKGTRKRNALDISQSVESVGGDLNAFTSEEMTCYFARLGSDHLEMALDVLFDMLWHSTFIKEEVERERGVIQEEIRMYEDQPHVHVGELLNSLLWKGNSLSRPIAGSVQTVENFTKQALVKFWKNHYIPQNLVVTVSGCFEEHRLQKLLQKHTNIERQGNRADSFKLKLRSYKTVQCLAEPKEIQQMNVSMGMRGYKRTDPRRFAERVLSIILGGNMSSRLFQTVREKHGLAYSVHTSASHFHDTGAFYIQAGLEAVNIEKAFKVIAKELSKIKNTRVSSAELKRAKDYIIGQLKLGLESTSNQMMWMGESIIGREEILDPHEVIDEVNSVTAEAVRGVAQDLFQPGKTFVACIGPEVTQSILKKWLAPFNQL
ncbi:MAG: pitrilysin family protein [Verrucomicrobiota bacterium]